MALYAACNLRTIGHPQSGTDHGFQREQQTWSVPDCYADQACSTKPLQKHRSTPLSGSMNESRLASNCSGAE
jgi:hypothetical protein